MALPALPAGAWSASQCVPVTSKAGSQTALESSLEGADQGRRLYCVCVSHFTGVLFFTGWKCLNTNYVKVRTAILTRVSQKSQSKFFTSLLGGEVWWGAILRGFPMSWPLSPSPHLHGSRGMAEGALSGPLQIQAPQLAEVRASPPQCLSRLVNICSQLLPRCLGWASLPRSPRSL